MPTLPLPLSPTFLYLRWTFILLLLIGEVIGLTALFDFNVAALNKSPDAVIQFSSHASVLLKLATSFVAAFVLLVSPRIPVIVAEIRQTKHRWRVWMAVHCLLFGAFVWYSTSILPASSHVIFSSSAIPVHPEAKWFVGWFAFGGLTLIPWLLTLAPWSFWSGLCRREYPAMLIALFASSLIWLGVLLSDAIMAPLAGVTLRFAHWILASIHPGVVYNIDQKLLGLSSYKVIIAPGCSGYEGIAMITVFVAIYLWLFRTELRFPQVLSLFPLGFLAIWLANIVRLVSMILFGEYISPSIASGGLHSQAGWINFTLIALLLLALSRRWFAIKESAQRDNTQAPLDVALVLPLLVMMGSLMLTSALSDGFEALYPLRVSITAAVLLYYRRAYQTLAWGWSWQAAAIGVLVFVIWMLLEPAGDNAGGHLQERLSKLPSGLMTLWLAFRLLGSVIIVPLVEELAFRGYLLRQLVSEDFENVSSKRFTWFSFIATSVLFGLLHGRWLAGTLAGMAFALALYRRGQIGDAVLAHVVANALIAASVLVLGSWSLWT